MTTDLIEATILDMEKDKAEVVKFFEWAVGAKEVIKIVRDLHLETYNKLRLAKKAFVDESDKLRALGYSYKDRTEMLGNRYYLADRWIAELVEKGKKIVIPRFDLWLQAGDMERLKRMGLKEFIRFYYSLGIF